MTDPDSVEDRIERARREEMNLHVARHSDEAYGFDSGCRPEGSANDPLVVEVENEESGRIHSVVPEVLYCSCEDHVYRDTICKHFVKVALDDDWIGEHTRTVVDHKVDVLDEEIKNVRQREQEVERRLIDLSVLQKEVEDTDLMDLVEESTTNYADEDLFEEQPEPTFGDGEDIEVRDDNRADDEFRSMIEDLREE